MYRLEVVNNYTNRINSSTYYSQKQVLYPELTFNVLPQTICRPDGGVEVINMSVISLNPALSKDQCSCDPAVAQNSALGIDAYEDDYIQDTYEYAWYTGQSPDPANIMSNSSDNYITGLGLGYYTVKVRNTNTNCETSSFFYVSQSIQYPNVIVVKKMAMEWLLVLSAMVQVSAILMGLPGQWPAIRWNFQEKSGKKGLMEPIP